MNRVIGSRGAASPLKTAILASRGPIIGVAAISGVINVLYLVGPLFMLQVYDRVLPSGSLPTLLALGAMMTALYAFQCVFEILRSRIFVRFAVALDASISARLFDTMVSSPERAGRDIGGLKPLRDLDKVKSFLSSGGPAALFDLPWMPFYLLICFGFHFWIGVTAVIGAGVLVVITIMTEFLSRRALQDASAASTLRDQIAASSTRTFDAVRAMGMASALRNRWLPANAAHAVDQRRTSDVIQALGAVSKTSRMFLQSIVLAVGAALVIEQQATGGIIIASSILTSRALAPVELAVANWRSFLAARAGWKSLDELLGRQADEREPLPLPEPSQSLSVENIRVVAPGGDRLLLNDVSFRLEAGSGLGVIGPSGSGKSTLLRAIVGAWPVIAGRVRLDGATLEQLDPTRLGPHIGYLPQDIELLSGPVADNIARFDPNASPDAVLRAAREAGVHDLILRLPQGYGTPVGFDGMALSAGQRQRIALARALYGEPFLVVLDEPNSNLDGEGEQALSHAILNIRRRGGIVIVVSHRPSAMLGLDQVLVLVNGAVQSFGQRDAILPTIMRAPEPPRSVTPRVVGDVNPSIAGAAQ